jgi:5'-nucleotidase
MHILLTNDDGILAPGLAAIYRELIALGNVSVAAPDSAQSASAHAITINAPLTASQVHVQNEFCGWAIGGRPADCVKLAVSELVEPRPDLVISGINDGANVSINVLYSGTVAAAAEGALLGIPAVAVSLEHGGELNFARAARIARALISRFIDDGLEPGTLVNVNIPRLQPGRPKGVRVVPQAVQAMNDHYDRHDGPMGMHQYWLRGSFKEYGDDANTDLRAVVDGYVAVTPLHVDLTNRARLNDLANVQWPDVTAEATLADG